MFRTLNYQSMADSLVLPFWFFSMYHAVLEIFFMLMNKLLCVSYAFGLHAAFLHFQGCK